MELRAFARACLGMAKKHIIPAAMSKLLSRLSIFRELLTFLWERKLWWLAPMVIMLVLFGLLLVFTQSSAIAPFIYSLF